MFAQSSSENGASRGRHTVVSRGSRRSLSLLSAKPVDGRHCGLSAVTDYVVTDNNARRHDDSNAWVLSVSILSFRLMSSDGKGRESGGSTALNDPEDRGGRGPPPEQCNC